LIAAARRLAGSDATTLQAALFDDVAQFARSPLQDDATLIVALLGPA
jgi:hypothetical protein